MNKIFSLSLLVGLIAVSCTDPNTIGLEVQPTSDNIIINSDDFINLLQLQNRKILYELMRL